jgi:rubrerythrin
MDRISSIKFAIENERSEMAYYLEQARRSGNAVARLLFETLAADEKEHMERIRGLHEQLTASGSWPADVPIDVAGTDIHARVTDLMRRKETSADHDDDDIAALARAARGEEDGSRFYAELAASCTNPQERTFFEFLSRIEREHLLSIKDSMLYLEDPAAWFEEKSRVGLDGA